MITEYLSYSGDMLVKDVLDDLRAEGEAYSDYDIQYAVCICGFRFRPTDRRSAVA
jgi:hypothetical protein